MRLLGFNIFYTFSNILGSNRNNLELLFNNIYNHMDISTKLLFTHALSKVIANNLISIFQSWWLIIIILKIVQLSWGEMTKISFMIFLWIIQSSLMSNKSNTNFSNSYIGFNNQQSNSFFSFPYCRCLTGCPPRDIPKVVGFGWGNAENRNSKVQGTQSLDRFGPLGA
jgi:hypothetical protein